ncbi:MAG TPA: alpha/beta hydrolase domain-containing protein [Chloroflexota bacterium]|nr:alpha/beta hydrolase domain-containing protein [Chloroflexota bacterium]
MAVSQLEIHRRAPYAGGQAFGEAGPYERLDGTIHFAVDPHHPANEGLVDLDQAPRDGFPGAQQRSERPGVGWSEGRVAFWADFCLLQPVEPRRGGGRLLLDVPNRGRRRAVAQFNRAAPEAAPSEAIDPGDGFLMRRGWTVAAVGWQWDVPRSPALMGLQAPLAGRHGAPPPGQVIVEFQPNAPCRDQLLANRVHHPYPAADVEDPQAVLTVREWMDGPRTVIPRQRWHFARDEAGHPVADPTHVWLEEGFAPGRLYEVVYRPAIAPVVGTGLLAVRDGASFLRYGAAASGNPCAGRIVHAYAYGVSQTGRFLRHFLHLGLNLDESGRQVFDGLLPHVAGARRGEFNQRFGQPSAQSVRGFGHLMPFTFDEQSDPLTGQRDGLLRRQRARGGVPRIVATNTAAEYWRGDGSLLHTDLLGQQDVEPPSEVRVYLFAGTQHGPGALPLGRVSPADGQRGQHPFNAVDYSPLLRAALVNLDRWVSQGEAPPPSVFPRLRDGSAVPATAVLKQFEAIPGVSLPDPQRLPVLRRLDLGPEAAAGVGRYPAVAGEPYPTFVSAVDRDGNEVGGIRLPDLTVPLATYTGWNPRDPTTGGEGQIINMQGSTIPFPVTAREGSGDPRPSIAERYRDRADYLARVRDAAHELVAQRYLLAEDVDTVVQLAAERYDAFAPAPQAPATV